MKLQLLTKSIFILFTVTLLSLGIDSLYRHQYDLPYQFPKNVFIHPEIEEKYQLVKVGNSHADEGLNLERYKLKTLSLASVAQSYEYDLATLKMYSRQIEPGAIIIINASPISFSQKKSGRNDNFQYTYYDGRLSPFLIPDLKVGDYLQSQIFPFLRAGYLWRKEYAQTVTDRIQAEREHQPYIATKPQKPHKSPPKALETVPITPTPTPADPAFNVSLIKNSLSANPPPPTEQFLESGRFMRDKWYYSGGFGEAYFGTNRKDLQSLIRYCHQKQWRPVLITIPISSVLVENLGLDYLETYIYRNLKQLKLEDVPFYDFYRLSSLADHPEFFSNTDHLNKKGAAALGYLLMEKLIADGYLPPSVDAFDYKPFPKP